jgi:hypothetical protein
MNNDIPIIYCVMLIYIYLQKCQSGQVNEKNYLEMIMFGRR